MQGTVEKIWENETNDNRKYHVLEVGGEKYSVWDSKLMEGLEEGSIIEYEWKKSGDFKKITDLRSLNGGQELDQPYKKNSKQMEIIRMSCLKSASEILHGLYIDPDVKTKKAVEIAKEFEKYVTGAEDSISD